MTNKTPPPDLWRSAFEYIENWLTLRHAQATAAHLAALHADEDFAYHYGFMLGLATTLQAIRDKQAQTITFEQAIQPPPPPLVITAPIFHITTNGYDRLCGAYYHPGEAIHAHYSGRVLDHGQWCEACQSEQKRRSEHNMKTKLRLAFTILLVILIGLALIGGCQPPPPPPPTQSTPDAMATLQEWADRYSGTATAAYNATATYGAEEFHIQLTAIATEGAKP